MSKHARAEDKLAVARKLREQIRSRQKALEQESARSINRNTPEAALDKGTNANNQFR